MYFELLIFKPSSLSLTAATSTDLLYYRIGDILSISGRRMESLDVAEFNSIGGYDDFLGSEISFFVFFGDE